MSSRRITFSADERLIEAARERARREHTTLNEQIRHWLADYAQGKWQADRAIAVIDEIRRYVATGGRKFTRDEMNER